MVRAAGARRRTACAAVALALTAAGCGGDDFANDPRPPATITLSTIVSARHVTVSPSRVGAGPIEILASNQTSRSQILRLRSEDLATGATPLAQTTGPINPGATATLTADLAEGTYVVSTRSPAIEPATITVRGRRPSAQDRLLQP